MYGAFASSHRRMVIRSLRNRKAIVNINQERNGFPKEIEEARKTIDEAQETITRNQGKLKYLKWDLKVMENKRIYQALTDRDKTYSEVMDFICSKG